jgi:Flp pilus assembly protein TadD
VKIVATHRNARRLLAGAVLVCCNCAALASGAEIVDLIGRGDFKQAQAGDWHQASIRQQLDGGAYVRTGDLSQMAVLLRDHTQLRLNQNSILQIRELAAGGTPTRLDLSAGRAWMQAKSRPAAASGGQPPALEIRTSNAVAAIRGTDWDIEVAPTGNVTLTVLSGEVDLYNDFGRVMVAANQQAYVEAGKAPVKRLLTNARERVQWVTAYRPQPHRWSTPGNPALTDAMAAIDREDFAGASRLLTGGDTDSVLLRADLLLFQGETARAMALLDAAWQADAGNSRVPALLARAHLLADQSAQARAVLDVALARHPKDTELWLAQAELARIAGDAGQTRAALNATLSLDGKQPDAWFGLGRLAAEREDVREARERLGRALELNPGGAGYRGELATLETFANRLAEADTAFGQALTEQPADYVALTGLGLLRLKQGRAEEALEPLLKAGLLEPRYARAALYTGIAYYQLNRPDRAGETLRRAAELDPRDPLPHMMLSRISADRMEFGAAIAQARRAAELMPFLKSLNQLANDQKGTANVGSALAQFGLEEWAHAHAYNAYTPYWAGSHLFLADRYSGEFNQNSELYQGFLSDPTVFGASNRQSPLVTRPGHYANVEFIRAREDLGYPQYSGTANGYFASPWPLAYYLNGEQTRFTPRTLDATGDTFSHTFGLGAKPNHDLGLFVFNTRRKMDFNLNGDFSGVQYIDDAVANSNERLDVGAHYRFAPESHLWLKIGRGDETREIDGGLRFPALTREMSQIFGVAFPDDGIMSQRGQTTVDDWQLRHVLDLDRRWQFGWGVESGKNSSRSRLGMIVPPLLIVSAEQTRFESRDIHLTNRLRPTDALTLQADISRQHLTRDYAFDRAYGFLFGSGIVIPGGSASDRTDLAEWNPRLGLAWQPTAGSLLRLAAQRWRKPAAPGTLATVDTAGIPLDDRLVAMGGQLKRLRAQYEWQPNGRLFAQAWGDRREIRNLVDDNGDLLQGFSVPDLERLRNKPNFIAQAYDPLEDTPEFGAARINAFGVAGNVLLRQDLSLATRYHRNDSRNLGNAYAGLQVPWLPKHLVNVTINWLPAARWHLAFKSTYRGRRYQDEANTEALAAGWLFGLHAYWESPDKRLYTEALIDNIKGRKGVSAKPSIYGMRLGYRF